MTNDSHFGLGAHANETNNLRACMHHDTKFLKLRRDSGIIDIRLAIAQNEMGIAWIMAGKYSVPRIYFESRLAHIEAWRMR